MKPVAVLYAPAPPPPPPAPLFGAAPPPEPPPPITTYSTLKGLPLVLLKSPEVVNACIVFPPKKLIAPPVAFSVPVYTVPV